MTWFVNEHDMTKLGWPAQMTVPQGSAPIARMEAVDGGKAKFRLTQRLQQCSQGMQTQSAI